MPWHVEKTSKCPASKPWGVIKDSDGSVVGCHVSKSDANKQLAALNINVAGASHGGGNMDGVRERPPRDSLVRALVGGYELREAGDGDGEAAGPVMVGHFTRFNEWTEVDSIFEGNFMERIVPGAFKKTFRERRDQIRALFQHGYDPVVGEKPLGPVDELHEDQDGAYYEVPLLDAPYVREHVLPGLRANLFGASFRFRVHREEFVDNPEMSDHNPKGLPERSLKELEVFEFGPVTFPAYASATAGVRSLTDQYIFDRMATHPEQVRHLLQNAPVSPSDADAAPGGTSDDERRDDKPKPTWPKVTDEEWEALWIPSI